LYFSLAFTEKQEKARKSKKKHNKAQ